MASYDPLLDLKDASFSDDRKDASFSDDRNRPMLHEVATAVGDHLHRFADAGAWLDANYDPATVTRRHLRESMDWQLLEEARRTPLTTPSDANADHETRKERRTFRRARMESLRDIKARWSNNRGRFLTAWLDVIHDLAKRPLDERTEDDASTTAYRLLLLTWLIAEPDADSREPVVTVLQNWPWERLSDDDAAISSRSAVRRELFGGPEQSGPKPRPVQGLGVLREGWKWALANLAALEADTGGGERKPAANWQDVAKKLWTLVKRNNRKWPASSYRQLAEKLNCSIALISKVVNKPEQCDNEDARKVQKAYANRHIDEHDVINATASPVGRKKINWAPLERDAEEDLRRSRQ